MGLNKADNRAIPTIITYAFKLYEFCTVRTYSEDDGSVVALRVG